MAAPWFSQLCSPGSSWLCSEWTDHVCLCRAAPSCSQLCSPGSSWQCSEPWLMFWSCRAALSCSQLCSPGSSWLCSENSGWCSEGTDQVCLCRAVPWCSWLVVLPGLYLGVGSCSVHKGELGVHRYSQTVRYVFTTAVTGLYLRAFLKYLLQTQELLQSIITRGSTQLGWCTTLTSVWER